MCDFIFALELEKKYPIFFQSEILNKIILVFAHKQKHLTKSVSCYKTPNTVQNKILL